MINPLATKLRHFAPLDDADSIALDRLCSDVRTYQAGKDLIKEGDRPEVVFLLLDGWACRYKMLRDGGRQIMAYLVPGDLCDIHIFLLREMDHSMALLSDAKVAVLQKQAILSIFEERPKLAKALWMATLTDEAVLREALVNMGRRDAYQRTAHLFVELWLRLRAVGRIIDGRFDVPLTQTDIGDTLGLTPVHVNRMVQRLRRDDLIEMSRGCLRIPDVPKLMRVIGFEANYLHLQGYRPEGRQEIAI